MHAADEGNADEDGEAEPYNKRDKDEVPSKALTGDSRPSDMEDAWGDDPRWQVMLPLPPSTKKKKKEKAHALVLQSQHTCNYPPTRSSI